TIWNPASGIRNSFWIATAGRARRGRSLGPAARIAANLPRRLPGGLRGGDRAPGRSRLSDPGRVPARAMRPGPSASRPAGDLRPGCAAADLVAAGLQPARVRIALGHGLFPRGEQGFRRGPQSRESPGFEATRLVEARSAALGRLSRVVLLCAELAPGPARMGRLVRASPRGRGPGLDAHRCG